MSIDIALKRACIISHLLQGCVLLPLSSVRLLVASHKNHCHVSKLTDCSPSVQLSNMPALFSLHVRLICPCRILLVLRFVKSVRGGRNVEGASKPHIYICNAVSLWKPCACVDHWAANAHSLWKVSEHLWRYAAPLRRQGSESHYTRPSDAESRH